MTHDMIRVLHYRLRAQLRAVAFWSAIALPFLHLPILLTGLETQDEVGAFLALLALNVLAVLIGHYHEQ